MSLDIIPLSQNPLASAIRDTINAIIADAGTGSGGGGGFAGDWDMTGAYAPQSFSAIPDSPYPLPTINGDQLTTDAPGGSGARGNATLVAGEQKWIAQQQVAAEITAGLAQYLTVLSADPLGCLQGTQPGVQVIHGVLGVQIEVDGVRTTIDAACTEGNPFLICTDMATNTLTIVTANGVYETGASLTAGWFPTYLCEAESDPAGYVTMEVSTVEGETFGLTPPAGFTPMLGYTEAALPVGAAEGLQYRVTGAGSYNGEAADAGDLVQFVDDTTTLFVTRAGTRATWHFGEGIPSDALGNDGDMYYAIDEQVVVGPKAAGVWNLADAVSLIGADGANGAAGTNGLNGKTIHTISLQPNVAIGVQGDYAIDPVTTHFFGPRAADGWGGTDLCDFIVLGNTVIAPHTALLNSSNEYANGNVDLSAANTTNGKRMVGFEIVDDVGFGGIYLSLCANQAPATDTGGVRIDRGDGNNVYIGGVATAIANAFEIGEQWLIAVDFATGDVVVKNSHGQEVTGTIAPGANLYRPAVRMGTYHLPVTIKLQSEGNDVSPPEGYLIGWQITPNPYVSLRATNPAVNTDDVVEGATNLFFTAGRAQAALAVTVAALEAADTALDVRVDALESAVAPVVPYDIPIACSDETTALTAGTAKVTLRAPRAFTLASVKASLSIAQTSGSIFTVDVKKGGVSVFSTLLTVDNGEKTSVTAVTPAVLSTTAIAADDEITIDITQIGDGTAKGLKVYLLGSI